MTLPMILAMPRTSVSKRRLSFRAVGAPFIAFAAAGYAPYAWGAPNDIYGIAPQSVARAHTDTAYAPATAAPAANPALLMRANGIEMQLGGAIQIPALKIKTANGEDPAPDPDGGFQFALAANLPIGSLRDRLYAGFHLYMPYGRLYQLDNTQERDVVIPNAESETNRFALDLALAVRVWKNIAIGAGVHIAPDVAGNVDIDFSNDGKNSSSHINVDLKFAPTAGIYANFDALYLGVAYRGQSRLSFDVPARVYVSDAIGPIHTRLSGYAYTEPHTVAIGARYDFSHLAPLKLLRFAVGADLEYRIYDFPIDLTANVTLYNDAGEVLSESDENFARYQNTFRFSAAVDWMPVDGLTVMAGYGYEQSPIPAQRGAFNVLDADRNQLAFGVTYWLPKNLLNSFGLGFSTAARIDFYDSRDMEKYTFLGGQNNPGFPHIQFSGFSAIWLGAIHLRFE